MKMDGRDRRYQLTTGNEAKRKRYHSFFFTPLHSAPYPHPSFTMSSQSDGTHSFALERFGKSNNPTPTPTSTLSSTLSQEGASVQLFFSLGMGCGRRSDNTKVYVYECTYLPSSLLGGPTPTSFLARDNKGTIHLDSCHYAKPNSPGRAPIQHRSSNPTNPSTTTTSTTGIQGVKAGFLW